MIVISASGRDCIEYHGSYYETHQLCDAKIHLWVIGIDARPYEVYSSDNVSECIALNKAMVSAYGAGSRIFSVATRLKKIREKSADRITNNAVGDNAPAPTVHS